MRSKLLESSARAPLKEGEGEVALAAVLVQWRRIGEELANALAAQEVLEGAGATELMQMQVAVMAVVAEGGELKAAVVAEVQRRWMQMKEAAMMAEQEVKEEKLRAEVIRPAMAALLAGEAEELDKVACDWICADAVQRMEVGAGGSEVDGKMAVQAAVAAWRQRLDVQAAVTETSYQSVWDTKANQSGVVSGVLAFDPTSLNSDQDSHALGIAHPIHADSAPDSFPSHPSSSQIARGPDEVTASLATHGLAHYAPAFRDIGYDDLDDLKSLSPEERLQGANGEPAQASPNDDEEGERIVLWFIKADKLRGCDDRVLPRFQDLQRQRPDWFVEKEITLEGACKHEYADEVLAVSHRWEQPAEPDTEGKQFAAMCVYVRGKPAIKLVWVDFSCAPQKERTPAEELVFGRTLRFVSLLFLGSRVLILCDRTYTTRFWTLLEAWISMQMVTDDGLVPAPREKRRCDIVPIHLASSVTASELETLVAGKSLDQIYAMLGSPDIQVTNQKDKGMQLAKLLALDHQVVRKMALPTLTLAGGAPRPSGGGAGVGTGADAPAPSKDERLQRLVEQVRSGSADAAGALADMRDDASRVAIARAGGIVPLVALLTAQDPAAGAEAARALRSLTFNDKNQVLIAQAGAIAPLVTQVKSGTDGQKGQAGGRF